MRERRPGNRSKFACEACNFRKVKCDLADPSRKGKGCTNCENRHVRCIIHQRNKRRPNKRGSQSGSLYKLPIVPDAQRKRGSSGELAFERSPADSGSGSASVSSELAGASPYALPAASDLLQPGSRPTSLDSGDSRNSSNSLNSSTSFESSCYAAETAELFPPLVPSQPLPPSSSSIHSMPRNKDLQPKFPALSAIKLNSAVVLRRDMAALIETELGLAVSASPVFLHKVSADLREDCNELAPDDVDLQILTSRGCLCLPEPALCHSYIDSFFSTYNEQLPIIDKDAFYRDYADLRSPRSLLLLYAVLYVGATVQDNFAKPPNEREQLQQIAKILFLRAKTLYDMPLETDPVVRVQTMLLFSFLSPPFGENEAYWVRQAVSVALQYGFHQDGQSKLVKRLWWLLVVKDRLIGFSHAQPLCINLAQASVSPLQAEDMQDTLSAGQIDYVLCIVRFAELIDNIMVEQEKMAQLLARHKSIVPLLKHCDLMLIEYLRQLPPALQFKSQVAETHTVQTCVISLLYYTVVLGVHQAGLRQDSSGCPSWAISLQAAQMVQFVMDTLISQDSFLKVCLFFHNTYSLASVVMLYSLHNGNETVQNIAHTFFLKSFWTMYNAKAHWRSWFPMMHTLGQLYCSPDTVAGMVRAIASPGVVEGTKPFNFPRSLFKFSWSARLEFVSSRYSDAVYDAECVMLDRGSIDPELLFTDVVFGPVLNPVPRVDSCGVSKECDKRRRLPTREQLRKALAGSADDSPLSECVNVFDLEPITEEEEEAARALAGGKNGTFVSTNPACIWMVNKTWHPNFRVHDGHTVSPFFLSIGGLGFRNGQAAVHKWPAAEPQTTDISRIDPSILSSFDPSLSFAHTFDAFGTNSPFPSLVSQAEPYIRDPQPPPRVLSVEVSEFSGGVEGRPALPLPHRNSLTHEDIFGSDNRMDPTGSFRY